MQREGLEFCAISTEPVIFQKSKLNLPTKNDIDNNYYNYNNDDDQFGCDRISKLD